MERIRFHLYRKISKVAGILASVIVFLGIVHGLNYLYVDVEAIGWHRILWHNYYENRGKIDNLYLGSSHVFCDINPQILDELSGQFNFNLSTSGQLMIESLYLLKEADRDNELSCVYLEMYYGVSANDKTINEEYWRNWYNIDYMKLSSNKIRYILSLDDSDDYLNVFFPFVRYRTELGDWEYVKQVVEKKRGEDYLAYQYCDDDVEYMQQGFRNNAKVYSESEMHYDQKTVFGKRTMGEKSEQYCRRIIEYCQSKDIPIKLYVSPICDLQLISTEGYDNYIKEIREIADEYEIPFYDFNLVKEQYLPLQANEHFGDIGHLNNVGSALFTPFFYEVMSGKEAENEKYFYPSYADKLQGNAPALYGIYYRNSEDAGQPQNVCIASNRDSEMEYKVMLIPTEGEPYII